MKLTFKDTVSTFSSARLPLVIEDFVKSNAPQTTGRTPGSIELLAAERLEPDASEVCGDVGWGFKVGLPQQSVREKVLIQTP